MKGTRELFGAIEYRGSLQALADHILLELIPPDTLISNITHASFTSQIYLVFQKIINSVSFINVLKYELKTWQINGKQQSVLMNISYCASINHTSKGMEHILQYYFSVNVGLLKVLQVVLALT